MKHIAYASALSIVLLWSCKKQDTVPAPRSDNDNTLPASYEKYTIRKGQQYCDQTAFVVVNYSELKFVVKFDSTAIYTTADPANQNDINKLYGFSDDSMEHHLYSARFGWRSSDNALRLFAYTYNNGVRNSKELGTVLPGSENNCSIRVAGKQYIFTLNNTSDTMVRSSTTARGSGYKLFPYFGGDETAPHDIVILIKEITAK